MLRLDDITRAGKQQHGVPVGDDHHRLQPAQGAVGAPVLGHLHRGAHQLATVALQLALEALEQREGVRGGAGKAGQHLPVVEAAHLAGVALHDHVAQRDLAVPANDHGAVTAHAQNGGSSETHGSSLSWARGCACS